MVRESGAQLEIGVRPGFHLSQEQAERYGARLYELIRTKRGIPISAREIVEAARSSRSALHDWFTWDDGEAAERWREEQARNLARAIQINIVVEGGGPPVPVRAFVYVEDRDAEGEQAGYVPLAEALGDEARYAYILERAYREYRALAMKHRHLKELSRLFPAREMARWDKRFRG